MAHIIFRGGSIFSNLMLPYKGYHLQESGKVSVEYLLPKSELPYIPAPNHYLKNDRTKLHRKNAIFFLQKALFKTLLMKFLENALKYGTSTTTSPQNHRLKLTTKVSPKRICDATFAKNIGGISSLTSFAKAAN